MIFYRSVLSSAVILCLMAGCGGGHSSDSSPTQVAFQSSDSFDEDHIRYEISDTGNQANGQQRSQALAAGAQRAVVAMPAMGFVPHAPQNAARIGYWSSTFDTGLIPIHLNVLPDGSLMYFGGESGVPDYNPKTLKFASVRSGEVFMEFPDAFDVASFCAGNISLPDGSILITGGTSRFAVNDQNAKLFGGANLLAKYQPGQNTVQNLANGLAKKRWYPTNVLMPNNAVVVLGGLDENGKAVAAPEVVNTSNGATRVLNGANMVSNSIGYSYPRAVAVSENRLFVLSRDTGTPYLLDISGNGSLERRNLGTPLPTGPMASIGQQRYLVAGSYGGRDAVKTSKVLQFSANSVSVTNTPNMVAGRTYHDLTTLPDGSVLATGGSSGLDNSNYFRTAERWVEGQGWTMLASAALNRGYHSSAVLLPDATVAKMGSTRPEQTQGEIFYPPYLFNADGSPRQRPLIQEISRASNSGRSDIWLTMGSDERVEKVTLLRLNAITHQTLMGDAFVTPQFRQNGRSISVSVSPNRVQVPAGRYWVFALNAAGTPSVAKMVTID